MVLSRVKSTDDVNILQQLRCQLKGPNRCFSFFSFFLTQRQGCFSHSSCIIQNEQDNSHCAYSRLQGASLDGLSPRPCAYKHVRATPASEERGRLTNHADLIGR